jgi:hypothetical protein
MLKIIIKGFSTVIFEKNTKRFMVLKKKTGHTPNYWDVINFVLILFFVSILPLNYFNFSIKDFCYKF